MSYIYYFPIYQLKISLLEKELPDNILSHCHTFCDTNRFYTSLYTWYTTCRIFKEELGMDLIDLYFSSNGKPYIKNSVFFISISHTDKLGVLMVSKQECGVDIEKKIESKRLDELANRILSSDDFSQYLNVIDKASYLTEKWTKREAAIKLLDGSLFSKIVLDNTFYTQATWMNVDTDVYNIAWALKSFEEMPKIQFYSK